MLSIRVLVGTSEILHDLLYSCCHITIVNCKFTSPSRMRQLITRLVMPGFFSFLALDLTTLFLCSSPFVPLCLCVYLVLRISFFLLQEFFKNLSHWIEQHAAMNDAGNFLIETCDDMVSLDLKQQLLILNGRWRDLFLKVKQVTNKTI